MSTAARSTTLPCELGSRCAMSRGQGQSRTRDDPVDLGTNNASPSTDKVAISDIVILQRLCAAILAMLGRGGQPERIAELYRDLLYACSHSAIHWPTNRARNRFLRPRSWPLFSIRSPARSDQKTRIDSLPVERKLISCGSRETGSWGHVANYSCRLMSKLSWRRCTTQRSHKMTRSSSRLKASQLEVRCLVYKLSLPAPAGLHPPTRWYLP